MRLYRILPVITLGFFLANAQTDPLTNALTTDLAAEWGANFSLCVRALKYKGQGKDDDALKQLVSGAPSEAARERYKIARSRPKDAFWILVAGAGVPNPGAIDCQSGLSNVLDLHLAARPKDLGDAAKDADTSGFLALYDLLLHISDLPVASQPNVANTYRACFAVDPNNLFTMVKAKLGEQ